MVQAATLGESVRDFLNLTEGVNWYEHHHDLRGANLSWSRIQSTALEQHRWDQVLRSFPADAYLHLAHGSIVRIWDCGARKSVPRAIWQGLPWIYHCIQTIWTGYPPEQSWVKGHNVTDYFQKVLAEEVSVSTWREVKYFAKFWSEGPIELYGISCPVGGPYEPTVSHPRFRKVYRAVDFLS